MQTCRLVARVVRSSTVQNRSFRSSHLRADALVPLLAHRSSPEEAEHICALVAAVREWRYQFGKALYASERTFVR